MTDLDNTRISLVACQEAVKKAVITQTTTVTSEMLKSLRLSLCESGSVFGLTLRRAIDPHVKVGYSRQYISRLEHDKDIITPEIEGAFWNIATAMDNVPAAVGGAVSVSVLAQPGQITNGALIKRSPCMRSKHCARPGCAVVFVGPGKYHDEECRREHYKTIRKNGNMSA
jgi:hypothetical protein